MQGSLRHSPSYALASSRFWSAFSVCRKSVLSIRPWKIGTPISIHREMTSRRCMPASRPSSVGVRWIAMYLCPPRRLQSVSLRVSVVPVGASKSSQIAASDRVRNRHEVVLDPELRGQELPEPANAEGLGGVVAARDEVGAALASVRHDVLGGLAGEERVEPKGDRLAEARRRRAGHDAHAADGVGARVPGERVLPEGLRAAAAQLVDGDPFLGAADEAHGLPAVLAERLGALQP